jgi:hypothetical protein
MGNVASHNERECSELRIEFSENRIIATMGKRHLRRVQGQTGAMERELWLKLNCS